MTSTRILSPDVCTPAGRAPRAIADTAPWIALLLSPGAVSFGGCGIDGACCARAATGSTAMTASAAISARVDRAAPWRAGCRSMAPCPTGLARRAGDPGRSYVSPCFRLRGEPVEVEITLRPRVLLAGPRPLLRIAVPAQLEVVAVRVGDVDRL